MIVLFAHIYLSQVRASVQAVYCFLSAVRDDERHKVYFVFGGKILSPCAFSVILGYHFRETN